MDQLLRALAQGLIWAPMGFGIFVSFRILREADLTAEASFTLGAATGAFSLLFGVHPLFSLVLSFIAGAAGGAITGLLITRLNIQPLLAGIITMTGLYSVNLTILGQANVSLHTVVTMRELLSGLGLPRNMDSLLLGLFVILILLLLLTTFFSTRAGQALIATGDNATMARANGIDTDSMKMLGFMLANGLVAITGNLVAQDNGFADISMGIGTVVLGLAAVILGEVLFRQLSLSARLAAIVPGSIIYRLLLLLVLQLHFSPENFKLFSALVLAICLGIPKLRAAAPSAATTAPTKTASGQTVAPVLTTAGPRLVLRGVDKTFRRDATHVLHAMDHLDLSVEAGDFITIIGANGAGKSTLLNAVAGTFLPDQGQILIDGRDITRQGEAVRAEEIARIFQNPAMGTAPRMSVAENLALAAHRGEARGLALALTETERERYRAALQTVGLGLEDRMDTEMQALSGGQRQAVALLMATIKKPKVLLLDEHTAALDPKTAQLILAFTERTIRENGLTALMITHNLEDALAYGNRLIYLDHGQIARSFSAEEKRAMRPVDLFGVLEGKVRF